LRINQEGILELYSDLETFELEDYHELLKSIKEISNGSKYPYLTDERGKQRYMDNASKKLMNDKLHEYISACAVVEDSAVMRFLVHTFTAIYRPKVPIKMFKTPEEAKVWLKTFI
jgi:hypothetical protein